MSGLILERQIGESIMIGDDIEVEVYAVRHGSRVRLRTIAPKHVAVDRKEVHLQKLKERNGAKSPNSR